MKIIDKQLIQQIRRRLFRLYGDRADRLTERLIMLSGRYGVGYDVSSGSEMWDQNDVVLIAYADHIREDAVPTLQTLRRFVVSRLKGAVSVVHLLPFYPWSSDDGFSVIDYRKVDARYGKWEDVETFAQDCELMFDLVLNHCSAKSPWFRDYVAGIAPERHYFVEASPEDDLSAVVRPRSLPLLSKIQTRGGETHVWTTFSPDQVDLDFRNPDVLFEFLDILLLYIAKGARIIRLDAVAFLWKKIGTSCIHLEETHEVVKLMRDFLSMVAPHVIILTETNVPHEENISYFGQGDEAHMVYNFTLPPLLLFSLLRGEKGKFAEWVQSLGEIPEGCTYFNFTASHDGIGVRPLQGIVEEEDLFWLVDQVRARGGRVSMRATPDGEKPYELNITYLDALSGSGDAALDRQRFLCSQAVALSLKGMPAIYFHSLVGTRNDHEGVKLTGQNRSINRKKWDLAELEENLADSNSDQNQIYNSYLKMLRRRHGHLAFHPEAEQTVLDTPEPVFGLMRKALDGSETIYCLFNFSEDEAKLNMAKVAPEINLQTSGYWKDLMAGRQLKSRKTLTLKPYQAVWLVWHAKG